MDGSRKAEPAMVYSFTIEPPSYYAFDDESEQLEKCKEWGLLSEKAAKTKSFFYKGSGKQLSCTIVGYVDNMTAVIEFDNEQRHCIHPSYLKEMQASTYTQKLVATGEDTTAAEPEGSAAPASGSAEAPDAAEPKAPKAKPKPKSEAAVKEKPPKEKAKKIDLPEEKVKLTAVVKEFVTVPNHFTEADDEVIVYEEVWITEPETELGTAWSSHSATLKKLELAVGDKLTFEAKLVAKKLTRHPVPYKINNPAKLQKVSQE
jgi:hypothetical protein